MLQISSNLDKAFDALLDTYASLGASLPVISAIDNLFTSNPLVQDTLIHVYKDVLTFHYRALQFFKKRGEHSTTSGGLYVLIQICRLANRPQFGNTTIRWAF
jgi:hypothetical protein